MESEKERIGNLIRQVQSGDKSAFEELYKLTSPRAYFVALKIVQNEHDAEDILQESYLKALEKIDEIDPDQNFMGWFYQVVANKSKDFLKGRKALVFEDGEEELFEDIPDESTQFSPEENLNQDELCREVMAAIDELTAEKRACVMMMYFGEMSVNEIAESLEIPVSTVKNRLFTARKDLKNKFEKRGTSALYSAAPLGAVIWALGKTSEAVEATFAASAASAEILAGIGASGISVAASSTAAATTTAAASASTAASTAAAGTGIAAKAAALTAAQKVIAGVVAVSVVGGSTAGVATVVKNHNEKQAETTTAYVEEVTTAPSQEVDFVFAQTEITEESTSESELTTEKREPTATTSKAEKTTRSSSTTARETTGTAQSKTTTEKATTRRQTTTRKQTTTKATTTQRITTTAAPTTTATKTETTTAVATTQAAATTATQPTTAAPATLIIEITDMGDTVVDTLSLTVPAETQLSYEYLISLVSANGYEAMAGVYGDAVDSTAEAGATYNFTAEL